MGFYASGNAEITVPANCAVIMALATGTLSEEVRNLLGNKVGGDLLLKILKNACRFDVWEDTTDDTGVRTIRCVLGDDWTSAADNAVRWLAEQGCGVTGQFTAEESDAWGYNTPVGHGSLIEHRLTYVPDYHAVVISKVASLVEAFGDVDVQSLGLPPNAETALTEVLQKASTP